MVTEVFRFFVFVFITGVVSCLAYLVFDIPDTFASGAGATIVALAFNGGCLFLFDYISNYKIVRKTADDYLPQ